MLIDAARPCRHAVGDRWFVDETYVKVAGVWRYVYRAVDQHGQVVDVYVSKRRNIAAARKFFGTALAACEPIGPLRSCFRAAQGPGTALMTRSLALY